MQCPALPVELKKNFQQFGPAVWPAKLTYMYVYIIYSSVGLAMIYTYTYKRANSVSTKILKVCLSDKLRSSLKFLK